MTSRGRWPSLFLIVVPLKSLTKCKRRIDTTGIFFLIHLNKYKGHLNTYLGGYRFFSFNTIFTTNATKRKQYKRKRIRALYSSPPPQSP